MESCYWGLNGKEIPFSKFSSHRLETAAESEGSILCRSETFWVACHSRNHTAWEQNCFMGWHSDVVCCEPAATGSNCVLVVNRGSQKRCPTSNEFSMAQFPLRWSPVSSQSHRCSQGCLTFCASWLWQLPRKELVTPLVLPPYTCKHRTVGKQKSCRFGRPAPA